MAPQLARMFNVPVVSEAELAGVPKDAANDYQPKALGAQLDQEFTQAGVAAELLTDKDIETAREEGHCSPRERPDPGSRQLLRDVARRGPADS